MSVLVTLPTFKAYVGVNRGVDVADDDLLQLALDSAEAGVNTICDRFIAPADTEFSERSFISRRRSILRIDDAAEIESVVDNGAELTVSEWQLDPPAGAARSGEYRPYSGIVRRGGWYDTYGWAAITISARWGWDVIPDRVTQAVLILAKDILRGKDIAFGIAGFTDYGAVRARENPQITQLLADLRLSTGIG